LICVDLDKQNGLYVEYDLEIVDAVDDPALTTREQAREYIDLARVFLDCF
jgi:hypothetical protein